MIVRKVLAVSILLASSLSCKFQTSEVSTAEVNDNSKVKQAQELVEQCVLGSKDSVNGTIQGLVDLARITSIGVVGVSGCIYGIYGEYAKNLLQMTHIPLVKHLRIPGTNRAIESCEWATNESEAFRTTLATVAISIPKLSKLATTLFTEYLPALPTGEKVRLSCNLITGLVTSYLTGQALSQVHKASKSANDLGYIFKNNPVEFNRIVLAASNDPGTRYTFLRYLILNSGHQSAIASKAAAVTTTGAVTATGAVLKSEGSLTVFKQLLPHLELDLMADEVRDVVRRFLSKYPQFKNLTVEQATAIRLWTGGHLSEMNRVMYQGTSEVTRWSPMINSLKSGLKHMPLMSKSWNRVMQVPKEIVEKWRRSGYIDVDNFWAFGDGIDIKGNVNIVLRETKLPYISPLSSFRSELEGLMAPLKPLGKRLKIVEDWSDEALEEYYLFVEIVNR